MSGSIRIDFRRAMLMLARALDYVGIDDRNHGHRVAYNAFLAAKRLQWPEDKQQFAYFSGLIHDCGVYSSKEHLRLIGQMQPEGTEGHCVRGYKALQKCSLLAQYAVPVRYHHTIWQDLSSLELSDHDKDIAALVFVADRVDFLRARYTKDTHEDFITLKEDLVIDNLRAHRGKLFREDIADAFIELAATDGFWYNMEEEYIESLVAHFQPQETYQRVLQIEEVIELSRLLAHIVDAKSPFTYQHSERVGDLSRLMSQRLQLPGDVEEQIYIAGLLHDIGKLRTPDEILHKAGRLTPEEGSHMRRHVVDSANTLNLFFPGSTIGFWAGNHHEKLDGSGYPHRLTADQLDLPSRIISVIDIFQALTQDRPYKGRLSPEEVLERMQPMVDGGQLDADVYAVLLDHLDEFYSQSIAS